MNEFDIKEKELLKREQRLKELEKEIQEKEKAFKQREKQKKQIILRLAPSLWEEIASWASDDFRSINSQIEYILTQAIKERKKGGTDHL